MNTAPRKASLLIVFLTVFIDLLGFGMVLPLLPIYAKSFGVDEHGLTLGLLMSSFSAMQFLFAPMWGRLSDRIGRRPVLMIGLAGSTTCYALFGVATLRHSLALLFAARMGAGIAGATISTAQAYIADSTTLKTRARGMALIGAAFGLGFTFGPLLGAAALLFAASPEDVGASPWPGYVAAGLSGLALLLAAVMLPESLRKESAPAQRTLFDLSSLKTAMAIPSIGLLLLTSFISVLSFGSFETTISLLLKGEKAGFQYTLAEVLYYFAFIGLVLTVAQGFLVRRLATRISETALATAGTLVSTVGFVCLAIASVRGEIAWLAVATIIEVTGFALVTPSLNSLISRRSDPAKQGGILGVAQSAGSLARIAGPLLAMPLFFVSPAAPYWVACGLMIASLMMVLIASRSGRDYESAENAAAATE